MTFKKYFVSLVVFLFASPVFAEEVVWNCLHANPALRNESKVEVTYHVKGFDTQLSVQRGDILTTYKQTFTELNSYSGKTYAFIQNTDSSMDYVLLECQKVESK